MLGACVDGEVGMVPRGRRGAGLTGCCGAPGSSFAVAKMEQVAWLPEEREPSEEDFLPDDPAERGTNTAREIQQLVQRCACYGANPMLFKRVFGKRRRRCQPPAPPGNGHI